MKGRRNIIIGISAIVAFASMVGFFITLDVSPQIAYARLFIDAGLAIGLVAVIMALYRESPLVTDSITHALASLKGANYKARISLEEQGPLSAIAKQINELAKALEEQQEKQEEIKRNLREELLPGILPKEKEPKALDHSYHPELGPVKAIPDSLVAIPIKAKDTSSTHGETCTIATKPPKVCDKKLSNPLIESKPPKGDDVNGISQVGLGSDQDMMELYQRFIDAQQEHNLDQVEYTTFLKTIDSTKDELMRSYGCQAVVFDIVKERDQVALQPKIIRS